MWQKGQMMRKILFGIACVMMFQWTSVPAQSAISAREACCIKYKGIWKQDRSGIYKCYALGNAPFYKCVASKGG